MKGKISRIHTELVLLDTTERSKIKDTWQGIRDAVTKGENVEKTYQEYSDAYTKSGRDSLHQKTYGEKLKTSYKGFAIYV